MIEENIIEWLDLGDSIQKLDLYNENLYFFKANFLLLQYCTFPLYFYIFIIFLHYAQIWELNILKIDIEGDGFLDIIKYLQKIFLLEELVTNDTTFKILLVILIFLIFISIFLSIINVFLYDKGKKATFLININAYINSLNLYFLSGASIHIPLTSILCYDDSKLVLCSFKNISKLIILIICIIYEIILIMSFILSSLYINDCGKINGSNTRSKINNNYTTILTSLKLIYFFSNFIVKFFVSNKNYVMIYIYYLIFVLGNISISIYSYKFLFYYNNYINLCFHFGNYYTSWFSICIFLKKLIRI